MDSFQDVWVQIAGNSSRIKEGKPPPHWRCRISGVADEHLLVQWTLRGVGTARNNGQGTNPGAAMSASSYIAWVWYYGDVVIDNERRALITLKDPPPTHSRPDSL